MAPANLGALGVVDLVAGMLLCFLGVRFVKVAAACAGFGLGGGLAVALGGGPGTVFVVGAGGAVGGIVLVTLLAGLTAFAIGALAAALFVVGAFRTLPAGVDLHTGVLVLLVCAVGLLGGGLTHLLRDPLLRAFTALGGAALVVRGVVEAGPAFLGFLGSPATWVESVVAFAALLALAWAGLVTQRSGAPSARK